LASSELSRTGLSFQFPDEYTPPQEKEEDWFGLAEARAMYYATNRYGYRLYSEDSTYNALVEVAQGRQSVDNIFRMYGYFTDRGQTGDDQQSLAYIDIQVLNLCTKYVNRAVAKLQRYRYNIALSAVDPISVDEAKSYNAQIRTLYELKDWFKSLKVDPQQIFPELDVSLLPEYPEELMFDLSVNQKIKKVIDAEKTLRLLHSINNTDQVLRETDWDSVVLGRRHMHCFNDRNKVPRIHRINPKYWGGSYVENEDYSRQEYAFFVDFITRNQFKKEVEGTLSKDKIDQVLTSHAFPNAGVTYGTLPEFYKNFDGLDYIPVMRFYFLSNDSRAFKVWKNSYGNPQIEERHYEYNPAKNPLKNSSVIRNQYTSLYGGSWVIDSEVVFNYGRKEMPRLNLVNQRLPIITFAPNMKEGRVVSLVSQMIEPLTMINVAWNKIKDILAKGRMGVLDLNLTALDEVALTRGGKVWNANDVIDFFMQSNIIISRRNISAYGQQVGEAIREIGAGLTLADYFNTITTSIRFLDELSGSTVIESASLPDRLAVGAMKANVNAGSDAIEYLVNGRLQSYQQASHIMLLLAQESMRDKVAIKGMIPALGTSTTEFFEVPDDIAYCEYGLVMEREPTEEEWIDFYNELASNVKEGKLNASDSAFIRDIRNMKMARQIMANREKINEAKALKMRAQDQQFQMQAGEKSDQRKLQMEMALLQQKQADAKELMAIQAKIDDALMTKKAMLEGEVNKVSDMVEMQIKKQAGIDMILKEAMRARSENYKADKQHESSLVKAAAQDRKQLEKSEK